MAVEVSIGQVKRDISELVNRVAYQGERVILTSRGRPKAVLVSLQDYEKIKNVEQSLPQRTAWLDEAQKLAKSIRERRGNNYIDVDSLLDANQRDMHDRGAILDNSSEE
jgi:prevent-host-death family protein